MRQTVLFSFPDPTLSPLGQLVTRAITPALPLAVRPAPGPSKRFAQGIGATCERCANIGGELADAS